MTASASASVQVYHGDAVEILRLLPDASVDAVVTDPPYGLAAEPDPVAILSAWLAGREWRPEGAGFMGKAWDACVPGPEVWRECRRVLRPGGWLVAFFATRTYGLGEVAIRLGGFEIRDMIAWLYGSGFPKGTNVAKAIARRRTEDLEPVRRVCRFLRAAMDARGLKSAELAPGFDCDPRLIDHWAARDSDSQPSLPTLSQWLALKAALGLGDDMDSEVVRLNGRKGQAGDAWTGAEVVGEHAGDPGGFAGERFGATDSSIRALEGEAAAWEGWNTNLKPALEPVVLARKPLAGTVAENVLAHGCGALNVDACRIEGAKKPAPVGQYGGSDVGATGLRGIRDGSADHLGRYPANVVHDGSPEVVEAFPAEAGAFAPVRGGEPSRPSANGVYGERGRVEARHHGDAGSAARFFYSAKADAEDRLGSEHVTVKPVDLMAWLARLTCRRGGVVLDPFAGTWTTGLAALREGCDAILIERDVASVEDIRRRLAWARGEGRLTALEMARELKTPKGRAKAKGEDTPLFGGGLREDVGS